MEHIAALLLIVGCSNDLSSCVELPAPVPVFEAFEECEDELAVGLRTFAGKHPRVVARCIAVDPAMEEEDAELTWDVTPDGTLVASIGTPDVMVAESPEATENGHESQQ
ncbi:MAG: hypothetical protein ABWZ57_19930 [Mesorhizobium sp.]